MNRNVSQMRLSSLLVAFVLVVGASAAQARIHSLTGNARFQIGNGLPLPITLAPPPQGGINAISGATIRQHGTQMASAPARVVIDPGQLTYPGTPGVNIPVLGANIHVFQVFTTLVYNFPKNKVEFQASGRTGAATVTFCGQSMSLPVTAHGNPACAHGTSGTGLIRYRKTANQFGGPAQGTVGGGGNVALNPISTPNCAGCPIAFFNIQPNPTGAGGGPFGYANMTSPTAPNPGLFLGSATPGGKVTALNTTLGAGTTNKGTSWGGPFTTGSVTASNPSATPPEKFTLKGNDGRASGSSGTGTLSLVAGGFSQRNISGPNANRGWLTLNIGPVISHVPAMPLQAVGALIGLLALSGGYVLRRRMARA